MTSTKMIRALHASIQLNQAKIKTLEKRIAELEEWIRYEGIIDDTCTYAILNKVCDGCRCGRLDTNPKSSQSSDEGGRGTDRGMVDGSI